MGARIIAITLALGVLALVATFILAVLRQPGTAVAAPQANTPTAELSEVLADGRIDLQVFASANRNVRLEIRFTPDGDAVETVDSRPDVNLAMVNMGMNSLVPPLEPVGAGLWRADVTLPMAGRWVVNVGFAEEFAGVEFDAE